MESNDILHIAGAARLLKISTATLRKACKESDIPHGKAGNRLLFSRKTLLEWMDRKSWGDSDSMPIDVASPETPAAVMDFPIPVLRDEMPESLSLSFGVARRLPPERRDESADILRRLDRMAARLDVLDAGVANIETRLSRIAGMPEIYGRLSRMEAAIRGIDEGRAAQLLELADWIDALPIDSAHETMVAHQRANGIRALAAQYQRKLS